MYENAFVEILEILKHTDLEDVKKIPKDIIEIFEKQKNPEYVFHFDTEKTLDENNVSEETKELLAYLFINYWATNEQRIKIEKYRFWQKEKYKH